MWLLLFAAVTVAQEAGDRRIDRALLNRKADAADGAKLRTAVPKLREEEKREADEPALPPSPQAVACETCTPGEAESDDSIPIDSGADECPLDPEGAVVDPEPPGWSVPWRCGLYVLIHVAEGGLLFAGLFSVPVISTNLMRVMARVHETRQTATAFAVFAAGIVVLELTQRLAVGDACYGWCGGVPVVLVPAVAGDVVQGVCLMLLTVLLLDHLLHQRYLGDTTVRPPTPCPFCPWPFTPA